MNPRSLNPLIAPLVIAVILTFLLAGASVFFYGRYQSANTNLQSQIDTAVEAAKSEQKTQLEAEFAENSKSPYETYQAPVALSSIKVTYPKTWSSHVIEKGGTGLVLNGYFHPRTVPDTKKKGLFALRVTLETNVYAKEVETYDKLVDKGDVTAKAVTISGVKGVRFDGAIEKDVRGAVVLIPVRDKTLTIWTENTDFNKDFTDIILKEFTFSP